MDPRLMDQVGFILDSHQPLGRSLGLRRMDSYKVLTLNMGKPVWSKVKLGLGSKEVIIENTHRPSPNSSISHLPTI